MAPDLEMLQTRRKATLTFHAPLTLHSKMWCHVPTLRGGPPVGLGDQCG